MSIQLYSEFHHPVPLEDKFPPGHPVQKMYKAKHWLAKEEQNEFIFQELKGEGFSVRFDSYHINEKASFTVTTDTTIFLQISMFQTLHYELARYGPVTMHQRGYNFITVPSFSGQYKVPEPALIIPLEISFSNDFLKSFSHTYIPLQEFLSKAEKGKPAHLFNTSQIVTTEMMAIIDLIILYGNDRDCDPDWINIYVTELLKQALKDKPGTQKVKANQEEIDRIYVAETSLHEPLDEATQNGMTELVPGVTMTGHSFTEPAEQFEDLSVGELAEYTGMSVYTFTKTFKEIFGYSVTNYKKEIKWQAILVMLARGIENMKTISSLAGYNDHPSFSRAFKNRFGTTPSEFVHDLMKKLKNYKKTANRNMG